MTFPDVITAFDRLYVPKQEPVIQPPAMPALWQHRPDEEVFGYIRECAGKLGGCPAIFPMQDSRVTITKQWQFFIRAINPGMSIQHVSALFGPKKAFTNRREDDLRADHLKGENLDRPDPEFDKVRTCSLSVMTGAPVDDNLLVVVMNGNRNPPLKTGRQYPDRLEDVRLDDYYYTPQTHRHLFFAANIVRADGRVSPFDNGAVYDWFGPRPVTWMPHVSRFQVLYPLKYLRPVSVVPEPYK